MRRIRVWDRPSMGGRLRIDVAAARGGRLDATQARDAAALVAGRVDAWAARLTRFDPASDLSRLNASADPVVTVGPTLAAVLAWAERASALTAGIVDVTLLDERLAAEDHGSLPFATGAACRPIAGRRWRVRPQARGAVVERQPGIRFDLDGVAKGWLADRALARFGAFAGATVDADGDAALRLAPGEEIAIEVADPA